MIYYNSFNNNFKTFHKEMFQYRWFYEWILSNYLGRIKTIFHKLNKEKMREHSPFQTIKPIIANISHDKKSKYRVSSCLHMSCPQPCFMSSWHISSQTYKSNFTPQPSEIYLRNTQVAQHRKADTRLKHERGKHNYPNRYPRTQLRQSAFQYPVQENPLNT